MYENKKHHINDKILKLAANSIELIINKSGIEGEILYPLPTVQNYRFNEYILDYACKMSDGVVRDLEFQKYKPEFKDIKRFIGYNSVLFFNNKQDSEILIIAMYPTEEKELKIRINEYSTITFKIICLKHINGDDGLKTLRRKINNKIPLTKEDTDYMKLMPLLETKEPSEEVLEEIIHLTNELETTDKEYSELKAMQELYVVKLIEDEDKRKELMKAVNMKVGLLDDAIEIGREQGIEQGREQGQVENNKEWINNLLDKNFSIEEIVDISGLSQDQILELTNDK